MRLPAIAFSIFLLLPCMAQDALLKGRVVDEADGSAIIGANVTYADGKGAATNADGRFSFPLPAGAHEITISFVGYATRKAQVSLAPGEEKELHVALVLNATELDMVVVTAGRFEQRVGEVTQSLSVIRPELVLNKNIVSMEDALDQVPGMIVVDGEPQIRAGSGFSYGAGSRVQVLVDDIPILSGDIGRPNWTFLPIENLEQVEVIKGASSVLYGSAALGGVVNVRTAYPRATPRTRVTMFTGMYDQPSQKEATWWGENDPMISGVNFFHSRQIGQLDLVLGGNAFSDAGHVGPEVPTRDTTGIIGPGGYDNRVRSNIALRWRDRKVEGLNYGVNANVMKSRSAAILIWDDIGAGLYRPEPNTVTTTIGSQFYVDPFINYHSKKGTRHSLRTRLHQQDFENNNDQSNSNQVLHAEYQIQQKVEILGPAVITAGVVYRNTFSTARLYSGDADGDGRNTALNNAAYLQLDKKFMERIALSAGVRHEIFKVNDDVAERPVFRAGATWQAFKATYVRMSYGQGFRFPTIGERFINTSVGQLRIYPNHDLSPETSTNIEGGIKQGFRIGGFQGYVDAVVFQQEYRDHVEFTFGQWAPSGIQIVNGEIVGPTGLGFKSVNTGNARVTGYELEMAGRGNIGRSTLAVLAGYTWTLPVSTTPDHVYGRNMLDPRIEYTYLTTSHDTTDHILKFRVRQLFRADVQWELGRILAGVSVRYNSHVCNIDNVFVALDRSPSSVLGLKTGISQWMDDHRTGDTVIDARVGVNITDQVRTTLIVNNLLNLEYAIRPLAIEAPRNFQLQLMVDLK